MTPSLTGYEFRLPTVRTVTQRLDKIYANAKTQTLRMALIHKRIERRFSSIAVFVCQPQHISQSTAYCSNEQ